MYYKILDEKSLAQSTDNKNIRLKARRGEIKAHTG